MYGIPGYQLIANNGKANSPGGVAILSKTTTTFKQRQYLENNSDGNYEIILIEPQLNNANVIVD